MSIDDFSLAMLSLRFCKAVSKWSVDRGNNMNFPTGVVQDGQGAVNGLTGRGAVEEIP
jgi:hypothetical protein